MNTALWIIAISSSGLLIYKFTKMYLNFKKPGWDWQKEDASSKKIKIRIKCFNCEKISKTEVSKGDGKIVGSRAECPKCNSDCEVLNRSPYSREYNFFEQEIKYYPTCDWGRNDE